MVFPAEGRIENTVCKYHKLLYTKNIPLNIYQDLMEQSVITRVLFQTQSFFTKHEEAFLKIFTYFLQIQILETTRGASSH